MSDVKDQIILGTTVNEVKSNGITRSGIPIGISLSDLSSHVSIFGGEGSGKTHLMKNIALQAVELGANAVILESGEYINRYEGILNELPASLLSKIGILDFHSDYPPAFPLLAIGETKEAIIDTALRVLSMYIPAYWKQSATMPEILRHSLHILIDTLGEKASLVALYRFISDNDFRHRILAQADEHESLSYWVNQIGPVLNGEKRDADIADVVMASQRYISTFLENVWLRRILALPQLGPRIDIAQSLDKDEYRLLLLSLGNDYLDSSVSRALGLLSVRMLSNVFQSRVEQQAAAQRRQTIVIGDSEYMLVGADEEMSNLLSYAGRSGSAVILSITFPEILSERMKQLFMTGTTHKIFLDMWYGKSFHAAFNIFDIAHLTPANLESIERYHGYVSLIAHGALQPPCYIKGLPSIKLPENDATPSNGVKMIEKPYISRELRGLHKLVEASSSIDCTSERAIEKLRAMDEATFLGLVAEEEAANYWRAMMLLAEPHRIPDTHNSVPYTPWI